MSDFKITPADLGWDEHTAQMPASREEMLGLISSVLGTLAELRQDIRDVRVAMAPKSELVRPGKLPGESVSDYNKAVLAENAALVLNAGQVLTQPEAQMRWFEAALANKQLRKHLSEEQILIYQHMAKLLTEISAREVYNDLRKKLIEAGYDESEQSLALI